MESTLTEIVEIRAEEVPLEWECEGEVVVRQIELKMLDMIFVVHQVPSQDKYPNL